MNAHYWEENYSGRRISDDSDGWLDMHADCFRSGDFVLDLGCGAGTNIEALLAMNTQVSAADFSKNAVEAVRDHFGERLIGADCFDMRLGLPYGDEAFDAVVADLSLHYFSWADTRSIIGEIRRALKKGGRLIARVHSLSNLDCAPEVEIEPHYYMTYGYPRRYFSLEEIQRLFAAWRLPVLHERVIYRYGRIKRVIEFIAEKR